MYYESAFIIWFVPVQYYYVVHYLLVGKYNCTGSCSYLRTLLQKVDMCVR